MASAHCDPPVRMVLHPALVETIHMTLYGTIIQDKLNTRYKHEVMPYLGHNLPSLIVIVTRDEV